MSDNPIFKVGDKVARMFRSQYEGSAVISKITPTGKIRTDDNRLYSENGKFITGDIWAQGGIEPWSEKHERIALKIAVGALFGKIVLYLTLPQLRELKALLDGFEEVDGG